MRVSIERRIRGACLVTPQRFGQISLHIVCLLSYDGAFKTYALTQTPVRETNRHDRGVLEFHVSIASSPARPEENLGVIIWCLIITKPTPRAEAWGLIEFRVIDFQIGTDADTY